MPSATDIERDAIKTLCTMALIGVVLALSPQLRRLLHRAFNP
jgi:hypothetical protein